MFLVKKFDQNDLELYKPCNQTIGNATFFKGKISRLPDYYYDVLEASARVEYSDEERQLVIDRALQEKKDFQKKLIEEMLDRQKHIIGENVEIIYKSTVYNGEKRN